MRVKGWERRLRAVVERHMALPAGYGTSDCLIIALGAVEAVTGEDPFPATVYNRRYKSARGALRRLHEAGFETVEDVLRSRFPEIAPSLAQRGDVGVVIVDGVVAAGVFTQIGFMTRGADSCLFLPTADKAFEVR